MCNVPYVYEHKMSCIQNANILNFSPADRIHFIRLLFRVLVCTVQRFL
jgi:hypothetical protein